jgi:ribonucleoside-triphosphate reductase
MVPGNNEEYMNFVAEVLSVISEENKKASKEYGIKFNTEFVPAENLGFKNALNDSKDGYFVPREVYNSYFYPVEDNDVNVIDKFVLHGDKLTKYLDGGSALHLNLAEHLSKKQYLKLFDIACITGCSYWCVNVKMTICNSCNHIDYKTYHSCPKCGSDNIDWATRIIGYLKRISSFSSPRQTESKKRIYHTSKGV